MNRGIPYRVSMRVSRRPSRMSMWYELCVLRLYIMYKSRAVWPLMRPCLRPKDGGRRGPPARPSSRPAETLYPRSAMPEVRRLVRSSGSGRVCDCAYKYTVTDTYTHRTWTIRPDMDTCTQTIHTHTSGVPRALRALARSIPPICTPSPQFLHSV